MRILRTRVSALAVAIVMASSMATVFSTSVKASDGRFVPPTNDQICAALDTAEANLVRLPAYFARLAQIAIDKAQAAYHCKATE